MPDVRIHYELREFHGDYDLCRVTADGMCLGIDAEIHNREIVDQIAETFQAQIVDQAAMPA